jgi:FeS assembly SUF system protein
MDNIPTVLGTERINPRVATMNETSAPVEQELDVQANIIAALRTCFDPEIPVNIYELGLIYGLDIDAAGSVKIQMTLTSPGCPVAGTLPKDVENKVRAVPGVSSVQVDLVWEPPWDPSRMTEAARLQLGFF